MKIRNGFVSNSSSSSFVLITKNTPTQNSEKYGQTWTRGSHQYNDYEDIYCDEFAGEVYFCRSNLIYIKSIKGKIRYLMGIYARYCMRDSDYFVKMLKARDKIFDLGCKHWYNISIEFPALKARWDYDYDDEKHKFVQNGDRVETYVDVYTECEYSKDIARMIEDEDTTLLDQFIFNKDSFCVLGGDEYEETYLLQQKAVEYLNERRKEVPDLEYIRFADYEDHEPGDVYGYKEDGTPLTYEYPYHWEEQCFNYDGPSEFLYEEDEEGDVELEYTEL